MSNRDKKIKFGELDLVIKKVSKSKTSFLENIDNFINWNPIELLLNKYIKRNKNTIGNPAFQNINMFKVLLLQRIYNLSDREIDDAISDRISFRIFIGFSFEYTTPDYTTICKFRHLLIKHKLDQKLFEIFNNQIETKGLIVRKGAIVDASLIESSANPKKTSSKNKVDKKYKDRDPEAKFCVKNNKIHYGYKVNLCSDKKNFILSGHLVSANNHDANGFIKAVKDANLKENSSVYADRAYPSKKNSTFLKKNKLKNKIMHKAYRNKKLSKIQKRENLKISPIRSNIEKIFGTLKVNYGLSRTRYLGIIKTNYLFLMAATCFNIKKACSLVY